MTTYIPVWRALVAAAILATTFAGCGLFPEESPAVTPASPGPSDQGAPPSADPGPEPTPEPTNPSEPPNAGGLPDGWAHTVECNENGRQCQLHLRDDRGSEVPGWPVDLPGSCWESEPVTAPDGTVYAGCTQAKRAHVHALDTMGRPVDGWPVHVQGRARGIDVTADGRVVVGTEGRRRRDFTVTVLGPDGRIQAGWPVALPGQYQGFALASDGAVVAWWYEDAIFEMELVARRTVFTRLDRNGHAERGWPIGSKGPASGPVADDEGGIVYTSASGRVWRHDARGRVVDGWPIQLSSPAAPIAVDGGFLFIDGGGATVLEPDGSVFGDWPWRARGGIATPSCDTGGYPMRPWALGPRGGLFLADHLEDDTRVVQLDRRGRMVDGWPWEVPAGWVVWGLTATADGGAAVTLGAACDTLAPVEVTLDRRGQTDDVVPTSQEAAYRSMQLGDLRTADAGADYDPGDSIEFSVDFANTSDKRLILPRREGEDGTYTVGALTSSLQRLGDDRSIPCLATQARRWYRLDRVVHEWTEPTTVRRGQAFPFAGTLGPELTSCLPAGSYRYRVQYHRWEYGDPGPTEGSATFDFTIAGP